MPSFFSSTDDKYELGDPGIHLVVGGIDVEKMKYTIAASVVGNGRRFTMSYNDLIDATPVEGVTFHPNVIHYVDYSTPSIKYSPVKTFNKTSGKDKNSNTDSYHYDKWLERYSNYKYNNYEYDNYMEDPFFYSEKSHHYDGTVENGRVVRLWEIEDLINDYIAQNTDDLNKMIQLYDTLVESAKEIDDFAFSSDQTP